MFKLTRLMATKLTHRVLLKILSTSSNSRSGSADGEKGDPATERSILVDEEETQPPANWLPITVSPRGDSSPELDFGDQRVIVPVARPKRRKAQKEKPEATVPDSSLV